MDAGGRSTRLSRRARLARAALALLALAAAALFVSGRVLRPPVLMEAQRSFFARDARSVLPEDAQRVELPLDATTTLRGWYLPADAGAPLVLHLLESSASVDLAHSSRALVARQLADLGFASLFLDYSGVGASSGERSAANLGRDARAMWDEAVRRVDGQPERVVLRCMSIGTLAALPLLEGGARPAGVILLLPVLPDTLAERFARSFHGRLAGWFARAVFRPVLDQDFFAVVAGTPTAWLAVQAEHDQMTSAAERDAIDAAILAAGGRTARLDDDHLVGTLALRELNAAELEFLTEVVPGVRDVEARWRRVDEGLDDDPRGAYVSDEVRVARLRALSAWSHVGDVRGLLAVEGLFEDPLQALRMRWWLAARRFSKLSAEELRRVADLNDPAGAIPLELVFEAARQDDLASRAGTLVLGSVERPGDIERHVREARSGDRESISGVWTTFANVRSGIELRPGELLGRLESSGLAPLDARRQLARVLLKAEAIADRCVVGEDGHIALEYFGDGAWHALQPDPDAPALAEEDTSWRATQLQMDASVED